MTIPTYKGAFDGGFFPMSHLSAGKIGTVDVVTLSTLVEGSDYISVDRSEDGSKLLIELDQTMLDTEVTEDSDNLVTSGAVYAAINA